MGYTDNCLAAVTATQVGIGVLTGDDCDWTVTYTYTIEDECGNLMLENQTYSYSGSDQTPPSLTGTGYVGDTDLNFCASAAVSGVPSWTAANAIMGYTDNCLAAVRATQVGIGVLTGSFRLPKKPMAL